MVCRRMATNRISSTKPAGRWGRDGGRGARGVGRGAWAVGWACVVGQWVRVGPKEVQAPTDWVHSGLAKSQAAAVRGRGCAGAPRPDAARPVA